MRKQSGNFYGHPCLPGLFCGCPCHWWEGVGYVWYLKGLQSSSHLPCLPSPLSLSLCMYITRLVVLCSYCDACPLKVNWVFEMLWVPRRVPYKTVEWICPCATVEWESGSAPIFQGGMDWMLARTTLLMLVCVWEDLGLIQKYEYPSMPLRNLF